MSKCLGEREQLSLFHALPCADLAPRDAQDLMAYPFFSLAKSRRVVPIRFEAANISLVVEGVPEHGIATIWDADILIWAASQVVEARDAGLRPSRWLAASPHQILRFAQRGTGSTEYQLLRAAMNRLQSTTVATSIRQAGKRLHRFSWISEWREHQRSDGQSDGIELVLADWFFSGVVDESLVLTLDPAYFRLSGGIERWLYRLVRKHGGRQAQGWRFDLRHLHSKSGILSRYSDFALKVRRLVRSQSLPGYRLSIERQGDIEWLRFRQQASASCAETVDLSTGVVENSVDDMCTGSGFRTHATRDIERIGLGISNARIGRQAA